MSKYFDSLGKFGAHLATLSASHILAIHDGLHRVAKRVENEAKSEIGHYQESYGNYPAWDLLADSTEREKERLGFPTEAPLLRTGKLRDTISHEVGPLEAVVGSTDPVMVYQEIGTEHIPPRPVLGPALYKNKEVVLDTLGAATLSGFLGHTKMAPNLGYDDEV